MNRKRLLAIIPTLVLAVSLLVGTTSVGVQAEAGDKRVNISLEDSSPPNRTIPRARAATPFTSTPNATIPDGGYIGVGDLDDGFGADAGMVCDVIDTSGTFPNSAIVQNVSVDLGITHDFVGDLTVKLQSPDGTILTLIERVQGDGTGNNTGDSGADEPYGDNSKLDGNLLNFADGNPHDPETMGQTLGTSEVVCTDDAICAFFPNPDEAGGSTDFAAFNGENASGSWTLCVGDSSPGDTGTLQTWSLHTEYFIPGSITIEKYTNIANEDIPGYDYVDFYFTTNFTDTFSLTPTEPFRGVTVFEDSITFDGLVGTHVFTETAQLGWELVTLSCNADETVVTNINTIAATVSLFISKGEDVTCTYTNAPLNLIFLPLIIR
jgi:subtilisin-like proprotein convertase family protein